MAGEQDTVIRRPATVWALLVASLVAGLGLLGLFGWLVLSFGGLSRSALLVGGSGAVLASGAFGLYTGRTWTRRVLGTGSLLGAWGSGMATLFFFLLAGDGFSGPSRTPAAISFAMFCIFVALMLLVRSTGVNEYLWASALGETGRSPDEELLDASEGEVELDFTQDPAADSADERTVSEEHEDHVKV